MTVEEIPLKELNQPKIDFLILADRAEAVNNKVYIMGGGWDTVFVQDFKAPVPISIAVAILIPWNSANEQHKLTIVGEDQDQRAEAFRLETTFVVGRPPHMNPGELQRVVLAIPSAAVPLPQPGTYRIVADVNGTARKEVFFKAIAQPLPQTQAPFGR